MNARRDHSASVINVCTVKHGVNSVFGFFVGSFFWFGSLCWMTKFCESWRWDRFYIFGQDISDYCVVAWCLSCYACNISKYKELKEMREATCVSVS